MPSSIASRVVPEIALTMARRSPKSALRSEDFPALGFPLITTSAPSAMTRPSRQVESLSRRIAVTRINRSCNVCKRSGGNSSSLKSNTCSTSAPIATSSLYSFERKLPNAPSSWERATCAATSDFAEMKSATASACVKSIFPFKNARRVYSPGSASLAPAASAASSKRREGKPPPCPCTSTVSSPV